MNPRSILSLGMSAALLTGCVAPSTYRPATPPQRQPPLVTQPSPQAVPATNPAPATSGFVAPQIMRGPGLEGVSEASATQLLNLFGAPALDVPEGDVRKLQFRGPSCVLDVFLYPLRPGAEPVATWLEARRPDNGNDVDRASCVRSLRR